MLARILSVAVLLFWGVAAGAATFSEAAKSMVLMSSDTAALHDSGRRQSFANSVGVYCAEVKTVYPRNSPSEEQWLSSEVQAGGDRLIRVLSSAEWGRRRAALFSDSCLAWLAKLKAQPDTPQPFVGLAYEFTRFSEDSDRLARKNGLDPEQLGFPLALRMTTEGLLLSALFIPTH